MNVVFFLLVVGSVACATFTGTMKAVTDASMEATRTSVTLAIGLIGQMALWLGFMRILRDGGLLAMLGRKLRPVMCRLFPDVPADHPAMSAMIMNLGANILGLANAATPFGLKAMRELNTLNPKPGVSTNAMALFLAINTSGVAVLPLGVIAVRSQLGAQRLDITIPTLIATSCSTLTAIVVCLIVQRLSWFKLDRYATSDAAAPKSEPEKIKGLDEAERIALEKKPAQPAFVLMAAAVAVALAWGMALHVTAYAAADGAFGALRTIAADWLLPLLMVAIVLFGFSRRLRIYESFIAGAKEGFDVAVMIIPFLVAILVSVSMFRASGALDLVLVPLAPLASFLAFPTELIPMALIRPLSGSGAMGVMTELMKAHGPDSFSGFAASVMNGSSETTFYVLAVYFGSIGVRAIRHTLIPCLCADAAGYMMAVVASRWFF